MISDQMYCLKEPKCEIFDPLDSWSFWSWLRSFFGENFVLEHAEYGREKSFKKVIAGI
jgi:hypothetical protein